MAAALKICFAASEVAPLAKTGGLADVAAALPATLRRMGHDVRAFFPFHSQIQLRPGAAQPVELARDVPLELGGRTRVFTAWTTHLPGSDLPVVLIDCPELFHRSGIYTSGADEGLRFVFFSRAVIESCQRLGFGPDVFHCNDWHTALLPLLLRTAYEWDALFSRTRTLLTIHNIGYQGVFSAATLDAAGLGPWRQRFDPHELRAGRVGFLRTGAIEADVVSTVSPTHAREIQTSEYGMGLEDVLRARSSTLVGILNGIDETAWNPSTDTFLPHRYDAADLAGKAKNKQHLLERLKLAPAPRAPLFGIVSRLTPQKGFDLCFDVLPKLLAERDARLVVLGSGEPGYEAFFETLQARFPDRVCFHRGHHEELAHVVEAASDAFLMPSRYEPCGLNQMFSLKYGTLPIVRKTGGLADTVQPVDGVEGRGTGFVFEHFTPQGLSWALGSALALWENPAAWGRIVQNAMAEDFSWDRQARRYVELYDWMVGR
jgi:starch synthase